MKSWFIWHYVALACLAVACVVPFVVHAAEHKPFIVQIESNVAQPCTIGFDDPSMAMAWIMLIGGRLTQDQFLQVARDIKENDKNLDGLIETIKAGIKVCIVGDGA